MKQLSLSKEDGTKKSDFAVLEAVRRSVFVCEKTGRIVFRNAFAAEEFPQIRRGSDISRFAKIRLSHDTVSFAEFLGEKRFVLCSAEPGGLFRIELPGGFVAGRDSAYIIRGLWENSRRDPGAFYGGSGAREQAALSALAQKLLKCLESLENDNAPEMNVCLCDLFSAVSRRIRLPLESVGAVFRFSCPPDLLCRASLNDPVFTLLNIIVFLTVYSGQKEVVALASERDSRCEVRFETNDGGRAAKYLFGFFSGRSAAGLDMAPLALAFEGARRAGGTLTSFARAGRTGIIWTLPLVRGRSELTVLNPDGIVEPALEEALEDFIGFAAGAITL